MPLTKFKRGDTYYIRGTVSAVGPDGEKRSVSFYKSSGTSDRSIAETIRIQTENRILNEIVHGKARVLTFREAAENYLETGASGRFLLDINKDGVERGLMVHFGDTNLSRITQEVLDKAAREMYPTATPETLNRQVYTPFIAVWNHAFASEPSMIRKWRRPRKAKGTNVSVLKKQRSGDRPVSYDHAAVFVSAMSPSPAMVMTLLFYTGLRPIEALALRAEDVDIARRWIVVRYSKTGEPRGVPMHDFLASWLPSLVRRAGEDGKPLLRGPRGEPYKAVEEGGGGLKSSINGARRRTGIKDVSPYTARHSVSTQLVVEGVHPHIKDQILGHAADDMSRHYTHVPQQPLIDAINRLPVPDAWRKLPWVAAPQEWWGRLAEGTGRRTDLERRKA